MNMDYQDLQEYVTKQQKPTNYGRIFTSFLIGAGVGVIAGILLAPRSGKDTMKQVSDATGEWKDQLGSLLNKAGSLASEYADKGKQYASQVSESAQKVVS